MPKRMARMVPLQELSTKNLTAEYYATVEMKCTAGKPHKRVFHNTEIPTDGPPICEVNNCGMPMLPVKAEVKINHLKVNMKGMIVTLDTLDEKDAPAIAREIAKQKKKPKRRK